MKRVTQYFDPVANQDTEDPTPTQIARWLEDYRRMLSANRPKKSKLISMKVPEDLLELFKTRAKQKSIPYQTLIKRLMEDWLRSSF